MLKGRSNYACLHRIREGVPDDQGALVELPEGRWARRCSSCAPGPRRRSRSSGTGERDNAPRHTDKEWRQVSVNHRECLGAAKCPFGQECFAERAREKAAPVPPHRHQPLAARDRRDRGRPDDPRVRRRGDRRGPRAVRPGDPGGRPTSCAAAEVERAGPAQPAPRRGRRGRRPRRRRRRAARRDQQGPSWPHRHDPRRPRRRPGAGPRRGASLPVGVPEGATTRAATPAASRPRAQSRKSSRPPTGWPPTSTPTCSGSARAPSGSRARLCVAPLAGLGADARQAAGRQDRGLHLSDPDARRRLRHGRDQRRAEAGPSASTGSRRDSATGSAVGDAMPWRGLDVGSPSTTAARPILYVARHLPPPGRDGLGAAQIDEIVDLVDAADGRTLGLFSSRRAAEAAAEVVRERLPHLIDARPGRRPAPGARGAVRR